MVNDLKQNLSLLQRIEQDDLELIITCQKRRDVFFPNGWDGKETLVVRDIDLKREEYPSVVSILPDWWEDWASPGACYLSSELFEELRCYMVNPPEFNSNLYEYILGIWKR